MTLVILKLQKKVEFTAVKYKHKESFCSETASSSKPSFFLAVYHSHNMDRHMASSLEEE